MKKWLLLLILCPIIANAQRMPSEQFVLYKVWSADSTSLKNLGWGDYVFSSADTVVLVGTEIDTVVFNIPHPRGFFTVWITADTANFPVGSENYDYLIGETDSLTVSFNPKLTASSDTKNPASALNYLRNLDWDAEANYYETIEPPLAEYLEFYLQHTGDSDTSAVIIKLLWQ